MRRLFRFILLFCLIWAVPAQAAQTGFAVNRIGKELEFSYQYLDYSGQYKDLRFRLNAQVVEKGNAEFQPFDGEAMKEYTLQTLQYHAAQMKGVNVTVDRVGDVLSFNARGNSDRVVQAALDEMKLRNEEAQEKFLESSFFIKDTTGKYILPDHIRVAARYIDRMRPVGKALMNQSQDRSPRGIANAALAFLQSIPYDTLQDRATSNGSGFTTPYGMLALNKGDCDTKSVALISILRGLNGRLPMVMVYTKNHAFVGIQIPAVSGDRVLTIDKKIYVLTEPAGPALYPLGKIGHASSSDLDRGYFSYVAVP